MSFWGIEEDYEAQAEADAATEMDFQASAVEEDYRHQMLMDQLQQGAEAGAAAGEAAYEKKADVAAVQQIKSDNTMMIIMVGAVAIGLFFLMKR